MSSFDVEGGDGGRGGNKGGARNGNYYHHGQRAYYHQPRRGGRQWTSWFIPVVALADVAVFIVTMFVNDCPKHEDEFSGKCVATALRRFSFQPLRENPLFGPSLRALEEMGALQWHKIVHNHQGWRLITCIWLHAGVIHLLADVISLLFIGIRLEQQFGFVRIGIIYLLSGFGGSILSVLFIKNTISVGSSGALFGLLGAMLSEIITNWTIYSNKGAALVTLLVIIAVNLAVGILPYVDNFAHIGGFLTGFFLGFICLLQPQFRWMERHNLPPESQVKSKYKLYQIILWAIALVLLITWFVVGLVMLFKGENGYKHCGWCHYLSCVPTSSWHCND